MWVAPHSRASAWRAGFRDNAMICSAPRRLAAIIAHRPTAPSPTTATVSPGFTPALIAAWWPVHISSDSARSERIVTSSWLEPGTLTRVASANGTRTASPWPPSTPWFPNEPPFAQFDVQAARQCGQVPSLKVNGATTKSPVATTLTADPTSPTTPMNSCPIGPSACGDSPR